MSDAQDEVRRLERTSGAGDFFRGAWLPFRGLSLLLRLPGLMGLAILPAFLTLLATGVTALVMLRTGDSVVRLLWARPGACVECGWGAALWNWLATGAWHLTWAVVGLALVSVVALVFARIVASPILDVLAAKVLATLKVRPPPGVVAFGDTPLLPQVLTSLWRSALRGSVFLVGVVLLWSVSLIPGLAAVTTPLGVLWTAAWLYVDTAIYPLQWVGDTRMAEVVRLFRSRPLLSLGFAASVTLLAVVPLAGLMTTPLAITGACYLVAAAQPAQPPAIVPATASAA